MVDKWQVYTLKCWALKDKEINNYIFPVITTLSPGLFDFGLIPMSTGHDMGVGTGSESDPSYWNRTLHLVPLKIRMI